MFSIHEMSDRNSSNQPVTWCHSWISILTDTVLWRSPMVYWNSWNTHSAIILVFSSVFITSSDLTFRRKVLREVSCGIYLLCLHLFLFWYWLDIRFLTSNCVLIDLLPEVFLSTVYWFYVCAVSERYISLLTKSLVEQ